MFFTYSEINQALNYNSIVPKSTFQTHRYKHLQIVLPKTDKYPN